MHAVSWFSIWGWRDMAPPFGKWVEVLGSRHEDTAAYGRNNGGCLLKSPRCWGFFVWPFSIQLNMNVFLKFFLVPETSQPVLSQFCNKSWVFKSVLVTKDPSTWWSKILCRYGHGEHSPRFVWRSSWEGPLAANLAWWEHFRVGWCWISIRVTVLFVSAALLVELGGTVLFLNGSPWAEADGEVLFRHGAAARELIVILDGTVDAAETQISRKEGCRACRDMPSLRFELAVNLWCNNVILTVISGDSCWRSLPTIWWPKE